jgi:glutamate-1-semialdehyde 2,1-aminomutase
MQRIFDQHDVNAVVVRQGSAHAFYFMQSSPKNWWQLITSHDFTFDTQLRKAFIERGVYYFPIATKQGSVSFAHTDQDIDRTLNVLSDLIGNGGAS